MPIPPLDCYSIALLPSQKIDTDCRAIIQRLAAQYNAPPFIPHISILTRMQGEEAVLIEQAQTIALTTKKIDIHVTGIEYRDMWNQCLFLRCALSDELVGLHQSAADIFGVQALKDFMPHLSILYGDYPESEKPEMAASVGSYPQSFTADRIALFRNKGLPSAWTVVREFVLRSSQSPSNPHREGTAR